MNDFSNLSAESVEDRLAQVSLMEIETGEPTTKELEKIMAEDTQNDEKKALRVQLEAQYGQVWDLQQLQSEFTIKSFGGGFVFLIRKADGVHGSMEFTHMPRLYFSFIAGA
jgi:superoxide dismutase